MLTRLAVTIVEHRYPQGDQFLFVRSDGRSIRGEIALLRACFERLRERIEAEDWQQDKAGSLAATLEPGFWESAGRFSLLGRIEVLDRIETGLSTAGSLLARLEGSKRGRRNRFPVDLVRRLAERLFLLDRAYSAFVNGQSQDAFLLVESGTDTAREAAATEEFAHSLGAMYENWAAARAMKAEVLEKRRIGESRLRRLMLAVSGYGAYPILAGEDGLHVLESPGDKGKASFERVKVRVRVVPQPDEPVGAVHRTAVEQAREAFAGRPAGELTVVRRYRKEPSPLVRDSIRGWRTGRWDKVFAGDFDLFTAGKDLNVIAATRPDSQK